MRKTSPEGINLIKDFEGLSLNVYKDSGGIPTIGWGHCLTPQEYHINQITYEEAEDLFKKDIQEKERNLFNLFGRGYLEDLDQKKYDALVCFIYNISLSDFSVSYTYKHLKKRDYKNGLTWWSKWVHDAKRQREPGLIRRRKKEIYTFDHQHHYLTELEKESLFA